MERFVLQSEAQNHVNAYLEYRMIVGGDYNDRLLSEKEYEKKKKAFYEKRRSGRAQILRTGGSRRGGRGRRAIRGRDKRGGNNRAVEMLGIEHQTVGEEGEYEQRRSVAKRKMKTSPLDLLMTKVTIKKDVEVPILAPQRGQRRRGRRNIQRRGGSSGRSRSQITSNLSLEEQVEILEEKLSAPNITKTTKYGLEKQLKVIKAKILREKRILREKMKQQNQY